MPYFSSQCLASLSFCSWAAYVFIAFRQQKPSTTKPYLMQLPSILLFLNILINSVTSQSINTTQTLSLEKAQLAVNSFIFILSAPANCLETLADLPRSTSKNMAALWIRAVFHEAGTLSIVPFYTQLTEIPLQKALGNLKQLPEQKKVEQMAL